MPHAVWHGQKIGKKERKEGRKRERKTTLFKSLFLEQVKSTIKLRSHRNFPNTNCPKTRVSFSISNDLSESGAFETSDEICCCSVAQSFLTHCDPWTAACQASLSHTVSWSLLKLLPIESVMPSNHLILCHPLLLLPSVFPITRVFSNESVLHIRWPKYWSFSFNISPSKEYSGLMSFRIDWRELHEVQGSLKCLLQHQLKSNNSLALSFFIVQFHIHT